MEKIKQEQHTFIIFYSLVSVRTAEVTGKRVGV
jgi:hypothetical protein